MFDQILDNYRKAAESTIQFQQELLQRWIQQWPGKTEGSAAPVPWAGQFGDTQKKLGQALTDMLTKHRETLDAQYRTGIKTIEDVFRVGEAKNPEQFRKLVEELWRQSIECLTNVVEAQMNDFRSATQKASEIASSATQKASEIASKGATAGSKG